MKTTLLILMLLIASIATAQQFELSTGISKGVVINRDLEADTYNATISVTPSFVFDKWKFSAVALSYSRNKEAGFFGGTQVSYQVLPGTYLNAHTLFGNTGKELYGGGVGYDFPQVSLFGNLSYETQAEESWIEVGMAYKIIQ